MENKHFDEQEELDFYPEEVAEEPVLNEYADSAYA